jgi:F0F1-type ATP synthase membrane subunit b/b'
VSPEVQEAIKNAKGSMGKKVLFWVLGIFGVLAAVVGIIFVLKGKGPVKGVKEAINKTKTEIAKADMDAKIKAAEAKGAEKQTLDKLKEIKEIEDEKTRLEELNKLL